MQKTQHGEQKMNDPEEFIRNKVNEADAFYLYDVKNKKEELSVRGFRASGDNWNVMVGPSKAMMISPETTETVAEGMIGILHDLGTPKNYIKIVLVKDEKPIMGFVNCTEMATGEM